jgi:hypothetical protein
LFVGFRLANVANTHVTFFGFYRLITHFHPPIGLWIS